jgi:hypothetical protein
MELVEVIHGVYPRTGMDRIQSTTFLITEGG